MSAYTTCPATGLVLQDFAATAGDRIVPGSVWMRARGAQPRPLVLVSHGGSGHRSSKAVLDVVACLAGIDDFIVAAIDGPVHGARRPVFEEGPGVRDEFRALWAEGTSVDPMVADWRAALAHVRATQSVNPAAIGWFGLSMGTAYGLPFIAAEAGITAAVLGMWGACRPGSERLVADAPSVRCPVVFQQKWDDPLFTRDGQARIFDALGSTQKKLCAYPGGHTDPKPGDEQFDDAIAFLRRHLSPRDGEAVSKG